MNYLKLNIDSLLMGSDKITTNLARFYRNGERMLVVELLPESEITLESVVNTYVKADAMMGNRMFTVLLDTTNHNTWNIPKEVLGFMAKTDFSKKHIAFAIVVDSIPMRMFANIYLTVHQPIAKTKVFSNRKNAENWLQSFSN